MADLRYTVEIDTKGAVSAVDGLRSSINGLASALALRELASFADGLTNIRNKLITVSDSVDVANKQFDALAGISIRTRTSLQSVADIFDKLNRASKDMGISQQQAAQVTETLAKALAASGTSSSAAQGALLQFGQAIQSGVVQGDELRSILEGLGPVAQILAQKLEVPVGALKQLGAQGGISARTLVDAILEAGGTVDKAFGKTAPTIGQSFEVLKTSLALVFDQLNKGTGATAGISDAILYVAYTIDKFRANIDDIIGPLTTFLKVLGFIAAFTLVGRVIEGIGLALAALVRLPGAIVAGLGLLIEGFASLGRTAQIVYGYISRFFRGTPMFAAENGAVANFTTLLGKLAERFPFLAKGLETITKGAADFGKGLAQAGVVAAAALDSILPEGLLSKITSFFSSSEDSAKKTTQSFEDFKKAANMGGDLSTQTGPDLTAEYNLKKMQERLDLVKLSNDQEVAGMSLSMGFARQRLNLDSELILKNGQLLNLTDAQKESQRVQLELGQARQESVKRLQDEVAKLTLQYSQLGTEQKKSTAAGGGEEMQGKIKLLNEQIKQTNGLYGQQIGAMPALIQKLETAKILEEDRKRTTENIVRNIEDQIARSEKLGDIIRGYNDRRVNLEFSATQVGASGIGKQLADTTHGIEQQAKAAARQFAESFSKFGEDMPVGAANELAAGLDEIAAAADKEKKQTLDLVIANYQYQQSMEALTRTFDQQSKARDALASASQTMLDNLKESQFAGQQMTRSPFEQQVEAIKESSRKAGLAAGRAFAASFNDSGDGLNSDQAQALVDGLADIERGYQRIASQQIENLNQSRTWSQGWSEAFKQYKDSAQNSAEQAKTYFDAFSKGFEDAIVRFVQTGKLSFKDLANTMIAEFARIQAKKLLAGIFDSGGGSGSGGFSLSTFFSSVGKIFGFASGGNPPVGVPSLIGERGPELFVPKTAGTVIPNNMLNMLGGQQQPSTTNVTYQIQAVDASSFRTMLARDPEFLYNVTQQGRRSMPIGSR